MSGSTGVQPPGQTIGRIRGGSRVPAAARVKAIWQRFHVKPGHVKAQNLGGAIRGFAYPGDHCKPAWRAR
jgi:hypothetical protein